MAVKARNGDTAIFESNMVTGVEANDIQHSAYFTECAELCFRLAGCKAFVYYDFGSPQQNQCHIWDLLN